jgi:hypothetical protein
LEVDPFGNQFLHLILPAEKLNFLNGLNGSNSFFGSSANGTEHENSYYYQNQEINGDQMLIEVGCKIFEVNRIAYTSNPQPIDFIPL